MDEYYPASESDGRRGRRFLRALVLLAIGFITGLIAMGYALTHWEVAGRYMKAPAPVAPPPVGMAATSPISRQPLPPSTIAAAAAAEQATTDRRVAVLEGRIARIDARADAAVGNADRAEGLLVAFAARRALDRGVALGYIETLLRDRFGEDQPNAVATIINAGHQPVRLDELQASLDEIAPQLIASGPDAGWWQDFRRELAGLLVLRRDGMPSPAPQDRLTRARNQLQTGHVDAALAEVARMPGRASAAQWIILARRYIAARSALDMIETEALLSPRAPAMPAAIEPEPEPEPTTAAPVRAVDQPNKNRRPGPPPYAPSAARFSR